MADTPDYLIEEDDSTIRDRMLGNISDEYDKSEGSFFWDAVSPAAVEFALAKMMAQELLRRGFASTVASTTPGEKTDELDWRVEEHGITRKPAVKATGYALFTGTIGASIPLGTQICTASTDTQPARIFQTTVEAMIGSGGNANVSIEAVEAGRVGNVAAGTIVFLVTPLTGVTTVINGDPTLGGVDEEDDISLLARYLQAVRNPSSSGNKADYIKWAMDIPGVGGAAAVPLEGGNGTVSVYLIGEDKRAASWALVDEVRQYIAPPHTVLHEEDKLVQSGYGTSLDNTQADGTLKTIKMVYNASGEGKLTTTRLDQYLPQAGIWSLRPHIKVNSTAGTANLVEVGVYNLTTQNWAKTSPSSGTDAVVTKRAVDLLTSFHPGGEPDPYANSPAAIEFYWDGQAQLELRLRRLTTDTTTTLWVDHMAYVSTFSKDTGEAKAPIGARVEIKPAPERAINLSATLVIANGYDPESVKAQVAVNYAEYIKGIAYQSDNDVKYVRVGQTILDTSGVEDYTDLLVNGGTSNIPILCHEVAVPGTVTLT